MDTPTIPVKSVPSPAKPIVPAKPSSPAKPVDNSTVPAKPSSSAKPVEPPATPATPVDKPTDPAKPVDKPAPKPPKAHVPVEKEVAPPVPAAKPAPHEVKLYNRWDASQVVVSDPGLRRYLNISAVIVPRTAGRYGTKSLTKPNMHLVERFLNKIQVSGHRGRKHRLSSGRQTGRVQTQTTALIAAFQMIEEKKKQNPLQILVKAVENAALYEETAAYRLGGTVARKSVTVSPQRRLDVALRHLSQGIQKSAFHNKKRLAEVIADELIAAAAADPKSFAIAERNRIEKEAEGSR